MTNSQPLISVIINCYNGEKYLKGAIDSVIVQTYENWEIIFWDNQSTDNSAAIVNSYDDSRIKYFFAPEHTLLGEARNKAVAKASGEWIGILDCDDIWYKDKLKNQLRDAASDIGMIYTRARFLVEESGFKTVMAKNKRNNFYPRRKELPSGNIFNELLYDCFIPPPSALIRKDIFVSVGGIDNSLKVAEDYDIFLKISRISNTLAIDDVLCEYRIHNNNMSHANLERSFSESIGLVNGYKESINTDVHIAYWKLKYLKILLREGKYLLFASILLTLNPVFVYRALRHRIYE